MYNFALHGNAIRADHLGLADVLLVVFPDFRDLALSQLVQSLLIECWKSAPLCTDTLILYKRTAYVPELNLQRQVFPYRGKIPPPTKARSSCPGWRRDSGFMRVAPPPVDHGSSRCSAGSGSSRNGSTGEQLLKHQEQLGNLQQGHLQVRHRPPTSGFRLRASR